MILGVFEEGRLRFDEHEAETLRGEDWVERLCLDFKAGDPVQPFINGRYRVGEALIQGRDRAEVDTRADELKLRLALQVTH